MLTDPEFFEDIMGIGTQGTKQFSLAHPDTHGNIKVLITVIDCFGDIETIERGLIPVNLFT